MPPDGPVLRVAGFASASLVNGPGRRAVLWVQGCTLACPGCFNPQTHAASGTPEAVATVAERVLAERGPGTIGLTLSGGEPFEQAVGLAALCAVLRGRWPDASLMAFSGFTLESLRGPEAPAGAGALLDALDVLVDGRFQRTLPSERPWRASDNQRLWILGKRPTGIDGPSPASAEIHFDADGAVILSGFPDAGLRRAIRELGR